MSVAQENVARMRELMATGVPAEDAARIVYGDELVNRALAEHEPAEEAPPPAPAIPRTPEPPAEAEWPELSFRCRQRHAGWLQAVADQSRCSVGQVIAWCVAQQYAHAKASKPIGSATDDTPGQQRSFTRGDFGIPT